MKMLNLALLPPTHSSRAITLQRKKSLWVPHAGFGIISGEAALPDSSFLLVVELIVALLQSLSIQCVERLSKLSRKGMSKSSRMSDDYVRSQPTRPGFQPRARKCASKIYHSNFNTTDITDRFSRIFHTSFMGTQNSSKETRDRAKELAVEIGSYHIDFNFDTVVTALTNLFTVVTNFQPKFKVHGGSRAENQALQNIQARLRMVLSYLFASLLPTVRQRPGGGGLLVLASSNVDG